MLFTKKHYIKIGEIVGSAMQDVNKAIPPEQLEYVLKGMSIMVGVMMTKLQEDNPRFKRGDFLKSLRSETPSK